MAQSEKIEALQVQLDKLLQDGYLDTWPDVVKLRDQVALERKKLDGINEMTTEELVTTTNPMWIQLKKDEAQSRNKIAGLQEQIDKTKKRIESLQKEAKVIPEKAALAQELRDAVDNTYVVFEKARRAKEAVDASRERANEKARSFVRILNQMSSEEAKFARPVYPNFLMFAGFGAFFGLMLGGGFAFIGEFAAPSFVTANQVRYSLQVPVLGEIAPLVTVAETKSKRRRRMAVVAALVVLVALIVLAHVFWFDTDLRSKLPSFVRSVMRRMYGAE
jgi:capsular polysaccharide biosynthesis protein